MCAVTCSCPSPSESKIGETNKRTKLHRHRKVNKETSNTPHAVTSRRSRAEERINVTLSWQAVYIKSHSFHLGTAGKCCKLAQCWTSSTCLRLGFVWFGEEKGKKKKREREISTSGNFNTTPYCRWHAIKGWCDLISVLNTERRQRQICYHSMACIGKEEKKKKRSMHVHGACCRKRCWLGAVFNAVSDYPLQAGWEKTGWNENSRGNKGAHLGFQWKNTISSGK